MKRIIFYLPLIVLVFNSCNKNRLDKNDVSNYTAVDQALVKFVNAYTALTPSAAATPNGPSVDFYINNVKVNAGALSYSSIFPVATAGYSAVPSGPVNVKAVLSRPAGGGLSSDTIVNVNTLFGAGIWHTIFLVDTLPNPTPFTPIFMNISEAPHRAAPGKFKIRLVNLIPTSDTLEIYSTLTSTVIATGVLFKNLSPWIELPLNATNEVYQLRKVGTTTVIASSAAFMPTSERVYTFYARGNPAVGKTRTLSFYTSQ